MQKILVVDDAEEIVVAVRNALIPLGVGIDTAYTVTQGLIKIIENQYDLVIIDIVLPDGDGFDFFLKLRTTPYGQKVPVIFLTAKEDVASKVSAFSSGADDYIVKPFHLLELRARVESRLKKYMERNLESDQITAGPLMLEVSSQRILLRGKSDYVSLTPREFKILLLLVKSPEQIFSREFILNKIWGSDVYVTDRTVDAHVCYLRKKLEKFSGYIESVPGEGYRFNPNHS